MIAVDTSVAVAAFGDWHRRNPEACADDDKIATAAQKAREGMQKLGDDKPGGGTSARP